MSGPEPAKLPAANRIAAIAAIELPAAGVGYLVTTFLFAFSAGQYRMVTVVNIGALVVLGVGVVTAAIAWRRRPPTTVLRWSAIATAVGWSAAVFVEWSISFLLGGG